MSGPVPTPVPLADIRQDGGTQIRVQVNMDTVKEYAASMLAGDKFPPVSLRFDGTSQWPTDGHHRLLAAALAGLDAIEAIILPGSQRDAILDAVGANADHGVRRTNQDKRQAVMTLLNDDEWRRMSDREIARLARVGADMVGRLRAPPSVADGQMSEKRTVTRGGKSFEMDVQRINRGRAPEPPSAGEGDQIQAGSTEVATPARVVVDDAPETTRADAPQAVETENVSLGIASDTDVAAEEQASLVTEATSLLDFSAARERDAVIQAIVALANAPSAESMAEVWATYTGLGVQVETVDRARKWLTSFARLFPAAETARRIAINSKMENI